MGPPNFVVEVMSSTFMSFCMNHVGVEVELAKFYVQKYLPEFGASSTTSNVVRSPRPSRPRALKKLTYGLVP